MPEIICTIGPKTLTPNMLSRMRDAGMTMVRLNGVHADIDWHTQAIDVVRKSTGLPILFDLPTFRKARWQTKAGLKIKDKGDMFEPQDRRRIELAWQCEHVAVSYIDTVDEREKAKEQAGNVIPKIETREGATNAPQLAEVSPAIIMDRRDLATEVGDLGVAVVQDSLLATGKAYVASDVLSSMLYRPKPSIADVTGIVQLAQGGATGIILAEETAVGDHPIECVKVLCQLTS